MQITPWNQPSRPLKYVISFTIFFWKTERITPTKRGMKRNQRWFCGKTVSVFPLLRYVRPPSIKGALRIVHCLSVRPPVCARLSNTQLTSWQLTKWIISDWSMRCIEDRADGCDYQCITDSKIWANASDEWTPNMNIRRQSFQHSQLLHGLLWYLSVGGGGSATHDVVWSQFPGWQPQRRPISAHRPACHRRREIETSINCPDIGDTAGIDGFHAPLIARCQLDSSRENSDVSRASESEQRRAGGPGWSRRAVCALLKFSDPTLSLSSSSSCKLVLTTSNEPRWRRRSVVTSRHVCGHWLPTITVAAQAI